MNPSDWKRLNKILAEWNIGGLVLSLLGFLLRDWRDLQLSFALFSLVTKLSYQDFFILKLKFNIKFKILILIQIEASLSLLSGNQALSSANCLNRLICFQLLFLYVPFLPESPRWLVWKARTSEALDVLVSIAHVNRLKIPSQD